MLARSDSGYVRGELEQRIVWWSQYTAQRDTPAMLSETAGESPASLAYSGTTELKAVLSPTASHRLPEDNVVVARIDVPADTSVQSKIVTLQAVPAGHKVATSLIRRGELVLKYNTTIGFASDDISAGTWMHSHNITFGDLVKDYRHGLDYVPLDPVLQHERVRFMRYVRADGRVATGNYIGIFALSHRGATVARKIAAFFDEVERAAFSSVDGVAPFTHEHGAGMERSGEPMQLLHRTLGGYIAHLNTAGALVVTAEGEDVDLNALFADQQLVPGPMLRTLGVGEAGGTRAAIAQGIEIVRTMLPAANEAKREPVSVEHIKVGLQFRGSDGFSGLSANPALSVAMEILVRNGGTAILSETSEIYGVEHTLTARARTPEVDNVS
ncbi:MAG: Altronate dehydratase (EC [uncultured Paraburkholderia sp.]|nr:MAG: Altronate dehydratase (EC [uncultured Paraburkholderia sp.]CAH2937984.1 MAG: Altronate dehydratase (EC [uncultured Paraburkholderia sp.]